MKFFKAYHTKNIQKKNALCKRTTHSIAEILRGTISIPDELLSSSARCRFLMAPLNYFSNCIFTNCPN